MSPRINAFGTAHVQPTLCYTQSAGCISLSFDAAHCWWWYVIFSAICTMYDVHSLFIFPCVRNKVVIVKKKAHKVFANCRMNFPFQGLYHFNKDFYSTNMCSRMLPNSFFIYQRNVLTLLIYFFIRLHSISANISNCCSMAFDITTIDVWWCHSGGLLQCNVRSPSPAFHFPLCSVIRLNSLPHFFLKE